MTARLIRPDVHLLGSCSLVIACAFAISGACATSVERRPYTPKAAVAAPTEPAAEDGVSDEPAAPKRAPMSVAQLMQAKRCPRGQFAEGRSCVNRCAADSIDWQPSRNANPRCNTQRELRQMIAKITLPLLKRKIEEFRAGVKRFEDRFGSRGREKAAVMQKRLRWLEELYDALREAKDQARRALEVLERESRGRRTGRGR